jgi:hypothetical protein
MRKRTRRRTPRRGSDCNVRQAAKSRTRRQTLHLFRIFDLICLDYLANSGLGRVRSDNAIGVSAVARDPGHEPFFSEVDMPRICDAKAKSQPARRFLEAKARE